MSNRRLHHLATQIVARTPEVLRQHRLLPHFRTWMLTAQPDGFTVLLGVLDDDRIVREQQRPLAAYIARAVLHDLSTILDGTPVYPSNSNGLRYGFVLQAGQVATLPPVVDLPPVNLDTLQIGVTYGSAPVAVNWNTAGHLLVAGATGSGKSTFLRALVYQALHAGHQLAVFDAGSRTFDYLTQHPALIAPPAKSFEQAQSVLDAILAEMARRENLFRQAPGYPDNMAEYNAVANSSGLPRLARLLVVLDEYTALIAALGGAKAEFSRRLAALVMEARKWGITLVFAGHNFTREASGFIRDQCATRLCFRVEDHPSASIVTGSVAATALRAPGRAILRGVGKVQTYQVPKALLIAHAQKRTTGPTPPTPDRGLAARVLQEHGGAVRIETFQACGLGYREARRKVEEWQRLGWAAHRRDSANAVMLTETFIANFLAESVTPVAQAEETQGAA